MAGRRRRASAAVFSALVLGAALGGCGTSSAPPQDSFYRLEAEDAGRRYGQPLLPGTVEVNRFSADGVTGERAILYSDGDRQLRRYSYHYWVDSPTRLAQQSLIEELRQAAAATTVVSPDLRVPADWRVSGEMERLEHHRSGEEPTSVMVSVEISVVNARTGELVMVDSFQATRPVESQRVAAAVGAFNGAWTDIVASFLDRLAEAAAARGIG